MNKSLSDGDLSETVTSAVFMIDGQDTQSNIDYKTVETNFERIRLYYVISEKSLSILLHVFIMVCFEIYFYFSFVIVIEEKLFIDRIDNYFDKVNKYYNDDVDNYYQLLVQHMMNYYPEREQELYDNYKNDKKEQKETLHELLVLSLIMLSVVTFFLLIAFINCLIIRKKIRWTWILIENILMFVFLGIFEYLFFINVIMNYSPISDAELQYTIYKNVRQIVNGTYS